MERVPTTSAGASPGGVDVRGAGLTAVVPCYDEGEQVDRAYAAIRDAFAGVDLELLFVDDGSKDDTLLRLRRLAATDPRVRYLSLTRNFGQHAAVTAGFRYAGKPWTVQLDADLQFPPEQAWALLDKAAEGYDVVFGVRRERHDPFVRRIGSSGHQWVARRLLGIEVPMGATAFRVVRTAVARTVADLPSRNSYLSARFVMAGARYTTVPTDHRERGSGRSRFRLAGLVGHAFELFFGFSWRLLGLAYVMAALSVGGALAVVVAAAAGAASTLVVAAVALLVAAATGASVAIVGRYLHGRLLDTSAMPLYFVREANVQLRPADTLDAGTPAVSPPTRAAAGGTR